MIDLINIIIVSDHGMMTVTPEKIIDLSKIIQPDSYEGWESGPMMMINPGNDSVYYRLKNNQDHYQVYKKDKIPEYLHFSKHPFIYPLLLIAEPGYTLADDRNLDAMLNNPYAGNHGYDNQRKSRS